MINAMLPGWEKYIFMLVQILDVLFYSREFLVYWRLASLVNEIFQPDVGLTPCTSIMAESSPITHKKLLRTFIGSERTWGAVVRLCTHSKKKILEIVSMERIRWFYVRRRVWYTDNNNRKVSNNSSTAICGHTGSPTSTEFIQGVFPPGYWPLVCTAPCFITVRILVEKMSFLLRGSSKNRRWSLLKSCF